MVDVVISDDALEKSKINAVIIQRIAKAMRDDPTPTRPSPSGKKWLETVRLDGARYAVSCRWMGDKIVMTFVRRAATRKVRTK